MPWTPKAWYSQGTPLQLRSGPVPFCLPVALCDASCSDTSDSDVKTYLSASSASFLRREALHATQSPAKSAINPIPAVLPESYRYIYHPVPLAGYMYMLKDISCAAKQRKHMSCLYILYRLPIDVIRIHEQCRAEISMFCLSFFDRRSGHILLFRIDFRLPAS